MELSGFCKIEATKINYNKSDGPKRGSYSAAFIELQAHDQAIDAVDKSLVEVPRTRTRNPRKRSLKSGRMRKKIHD